MTTSWKRLNLLASEPTQATPNDVRSMAHEIMERRRADASPVELDELRRLHEVDRQVEARAAACPEHGEHCDGPDCCCADKHTEVDDG